MRHLATMILATIGSAIGWSLGKHVGFGTAFLASVVGTALGVYVSRRYLRNLLG